jgi:hypothetical protein
MFRCLTCHQLAAKGYICEECELWIELTFSVGARVSGHLNLLIVEERLQNLMTTKG